MEFDGTEYNKENFVKPPVTPERLAEILYKGLSEKFCPYDTDEIVCLHLAAELLKVLRIEEKE